MKRNFKNWLRAYISFTQHSESPDVFHFWTGVSTIAGTLQRKVWIDQRYFQWTPNFYIVFVAPPGIATKSTSIGVGMSLLREVPGVHFGPRSVTWQQFLSSLEDAQTLVEIPKGGEMHSMACMTCAVSELGTFLRPDNSDMVDVLTDLWDGQKDVWDRATKTQGKIEIQNPWVNVIGATTPAWIKQNFPEYLVGGGLTSRIIFAYAKEKRHLVAYPADAINQEEHQAFRERLIEDLLIMNDEIRGEYELTPAAKEWGRDWYKEHWTQRPTHLAHERFAGYMARKQTHLHKFAMIHAASIRNELYIDKVDLELGNQIVTALEADMHRVFEAIGVSDASRFTLQVKDTLASHGKVNYTQLFRECTLRMGKREFEEALETLIKAGNARLFQSSEGPTVQFIKQD